MIVKQSQMTSNKLLDFPSNSPVTNNHSQQGGQKFDRFWFIHILLCRFNPIRSQLETVLDFWLVNVWTEECQLIKGRHTFGLLAITIAVRTHFVQGEPPCHLWILNLGNSKSKGRWKTVWVSSGSNYSSKYSIFHVNYWYTHNKHREIQVNCVRLDVSTHQLSWQAFMSSLN